MTGNSYKKFLFLLFFLTLAGFSFATHPDSIPFWFEKHLHLNPLEKIYIQHDKPFYTAGEDIWFRIYKVDGTTHFPVTFSRYVYVELINPIDSLIARVKIRPENNTWSGHIPLKEELAEGEYKIRAYTLLMENAGADYFFNKSIYISTPLGIALKPIIDFTPAKQKNEIDVTIHFTDPSGKLNFPQTIDIKDKNNQVQTLESLPDKSFRFTVNRKDFQKELLHLSYSRHTLEHAQYIPIPEIKSDYDVQFFPEGGSVVAGNKNKIAFKAINTTGLGEEIEGEIYDEKDNLLLHFQTEHKGMGAFELFIDNPTGYYAICRNNYGDEKKIPLFKNSSKNHSLQVIRENNDIIVSVLTSPEKQKIPTWLSVQTRGKILYSGHWNFEDETLCFNEKELPTGIIHFLLSDANNQILSERLFFSLNPNSFTNSEITFEKTDYTTREKVDMEIFLSDAAGNPLEASLSVAVTDLPAEKNLTSSNIFSSLLLTSDLKGYIEEPGWYFTDINKEKRRYLDHLMLTQGWTKYTVQDILSGKMQPFNGTIEIGPSISGKVKDGILMTKKGRGLPVTLLSADPFYAEETETDNNGKFYFVGTEFPDSMLFFVQSFTHRGGKRVEVEIDQPVFPEIKTATPLLYTPQQLSLFFEQRHQEIFTDYSDMWTIHLDDIVIKAKPLGKSRYSSRLNKIITAEDIKNSGLYDLNEILMRENGIREETIRFRDDERRIVTIGGHSPTIVIDNQIWNLNDGLPLISPGDLKVDNIDQVEIVRDTQYYSYLHDKSKTAILITTKTGQVIYRPKPQFNLKSISPLGFQQKKEFYTPKYETEEQKGSEKPDWRSTIFWDPDVNTDSTGIAHVEFYTSDNTDTHYTIIVEGITRDGKLIHYSGQLPIATSTPE